MIASVDTVGRDAVFAVSVKNSGGSRFRYGVRGDVDTWDREDWQPYGEFVSSLTHWGGAGRIGPPSFAPAIGLGALPGGYGPLEWLTTRGLTDGRYRLGHGAAKVTIRVAAEGQTATFDRGVNRFLSRPEVVPSTGAVIRLRALTTAESDGTLVPLHIEDLRDQTVSLARWADGRWTVIETRTTQPHVSPDEAAVNLRLSDVVPGMYRLTATHTALGELVGHVMVDTSPSEP